MSRPRLLALTCRGPLESRYGAAGYNDVLTDLQLLQAALAGDGWEFSLLVPDDPDICVLWGSALATSADASRLGSEIRRACVRKPDIAAVLLVGDPGIVPFWRLPNPYSDADSEVFSDNPYGFSVDATDGWLTPDLSLGRLTGDSTDGLESLRAHIRQMTALHQLDSGKTGGQAVCAQVWQGATLRVAGTMGVGVPTETSPSFSLLMPSGSAAAFSRKFLFFNLHGRKGESQWFGQGGAGSVDCIAPAGLRSADLRDSVIFAANCYGLNIESLPADRSCALSAVARGARAFVGATALAYGMNSAGASTIAYAERLAQWFFHFIQQGKNTGAALRLARQQFRAESNPPSKVGRKTLIEFVLLGDPTL